MLEFTNNILPSITNLGFFGYWVVFLIALFEGLPFIGLILPGATIVVIVGFLSSIDYLEIGDLIWFITIGAIIGDLIGFYLGSRGTRFFKNENKLLKLSHLEKAQMFFCQHGSKSIFIGRFTGPIRPIIPFVAGLSKMRVGSFIFWDVIAALTWSVSHLLLGYFFGNALRILQRFSYVITTIFVVGVITIGLIWIVRRNGGLKNISDKLKTVSLLISKSFWSRVIFFFEIFFGIKNLKQASQKKTSMKIIFSCLFLLFIFPLAVYFAGFIPKIKDFVILTDNLILLFFNSIRTVWLSKLFVGLTELGNYKVIIGLTFATCVFLFSMNLRKILFPLLTVVGGTGIYAFILKEIFSRVRPEGIFTSFESTYSFPSSHAAIAVAFYGLLAYLVFRFSRMNLIKIVSSILFIVLAVAIAFSRVYLGVHYLSDVLAGFFVGWLWFFISAALIEIFG